jgi:hypothetical protein
MKVQREYIEKMEYDVIVCGGGPAGVAAAISAGRKGVKTLLIERGGCLGGFWTRGMLTWLIDTEEKEGLINEVLEILEREADGKRIAKPKRFTADTEKTKLILERLCIDAGVQVLYHTVVSGAVKEEHKITHVLTESKSGAIAYGAKMFIDTTGDGDLGYFAGASYSLGNAEGVTQPLSLVCQISGVAYDEMEPFDSRRSKDTKQAMLKELEEIGIEPSYRAPLLAVLSEQYDTYGLMINHEYSSSLDAEAISNATMHAREELHRIVDGLRSKGGIWEQLHISATSDAIGVREGRRIHGLYTLTKEDVYAGRQFSDGICSVAFGTDVHSLKPGASAFDHHIYGNKHEPYQIPVRSLICADIDNLLMGGRCISGDFVAHASYRVAGPAFRTGEVAGLLAAYCANNQVLPKFAIEPQF